MRLKLFIESMDADMAFPNDTLQERIYIDRPVGYPHVASGTVLSFIRRCMDWSNLWGNGTLPWTKSSGMIWKDSTGNGAAYLC